MNKARRKEIDEIISLVEQAKERLEAVRDDEQEYYDCMPENFQQGEKGEQAEEAVNCLDQAIDSLDEAIDSAGQAQG